MKLLILALQLVVLNEVTHSRWLTLRPEMFPFHQDMTERFKQSEICSDLSELFTQGSCFHPVQQAHRHAFAAHWTHTHTHAQTRACRLGLLLVQPRDWHLICQFCGALAYILGYMQMQKYWDRGRDGQMDTEGKIDRQGGVVTRIKSICRVPMPQTARQRCCMRITTRPWVAHNITFLWVCLHLYNFSPLLHMGLHLVCFVFPLVVLLKLLRFIFRYILRGHNMMKSI